MCNYEEGLCPADSKNCPYASGMARRASKSRPAQGAQLAALRQAAGLSQAELARAIGVPQQNVAFWELSDKPPRSDALPKLAHVLGVKVEALLSPSMPPGARRSGPKGRLLKVFEAAASLPRPQQQLVEQFVYTLLAQQRGRAA